MAEQPDLRGRLAAAWRFAAPAALFVFGVCALVGGAAAALGPERPRSAVDAASGAVVVAPTGTFTADGGWSCPARGGGGGGAA